MKVALVQARMGSTRLPGKVLMDVHGKTLVGNLVDRIKTAQHLDELIIVTTNNPEDDALEQWCNNNDVKCYRGSDWDVLDRFYQAANSLPEKPEHVIRICCDNPLHSHKVVDFVVAAYLEAGTDYFSNSNHEPDFLEDGFDVEVFTYASLETAWKEAKLLSQREHVTPYIKDSGKFTCSWKKANKDYTYKLSVDTEADLSAVTQIFEELDEVDDFGIDEVVGLLQKKPEILDLNKESIINSGYQKSLDNDKIIE